MPDRENHQLSAERWRQTPSERKRQQRQSERNKRYRKVPIEITQQPTKKRGVWMGRVSYEWKSGPKRGQKTSVPVTLNTPAKLSIRGKDLMVKPRDGEMYVWGEKEDEKKLGTDADGKPIRKSEDGKAREQRLRDKLKEKYDKLIAEHGPLEAGRTMAKGFVLAHNKLKGKNAKRALAKVYGVVLKTNKAAHRAFGRAVKQSRSMTARKPKTEAAVMASGIQVGDIVKHDLISNLFRVKEVNKNEVVVEDENYLGHPTEHTFPIEDVMKADLPVLMGSITFGWYGGGKLSAFAGLPSDEEFAALDHLPKVRQKLYAARPYVGRKVGVRLDIPSVKRGLPVVSIHAKPSGGPVIGYDHSATTRNARFIVQTAAQRDIGVMGANKRPMAYIGGTLSDEPAQAAGIPIYYDPRKVHLFVDARNMRPVKGARVVYSVGKKVFAEGLEYYEPGEAPPPPEGMHSLVKMPGGEPAPMMASGSAMGRRERLLVAAALANAAQTLDPESGAEVQAFIQTIKKKLAERKVQKSADKYRKEKGKCPRGFRFSKEKGKCLPVSEETRRAEKAEREVRKLKKKQAAPPAPAPTGKAPAKKGAPPAKKKAVPSPVDFGDASKPKGKKAPPAPTGKAPAKKAPAKKAPPAPAKKAPAKKGAPAPTGKAPAKKAPPAGAPAPAKKKAPAKKAPQKTGKVSKGPLNLGILEQAPEPAKKKAPAKKAPPAKGKAPAKKAPVKKGVPPAKGKPSPKKAPPAKGKAPAKKPKVAASSQPEFDTDTIRRATWPLVFG